MAVPETQMSKFRAAVNGRLSDDEIAGVVALVDEIAKMDGKGLPSAALIRFTKTSFLTPARIRVTVNVLMSMKLYVGNLSFQTSGHELEELFATFGQVDSATVVEDRETGRSRGFGFVEMASKDDGKKAIEDLDGKPFGGRAPVQAGRLSGRQRL